MDKISGLSDVSTSILSKRWKYLWMWLPKLEYGHRRSSPSVCESLQCFLDKNLPLYRAPVLESLCLDLDLSSGNFKPENIKLWVVIAVSHCVRELEIMYSSYPSKPNILPSNLYTCKSLVILKLNGGILLDVPRMVFLPYLKTLKLESVRYLNEESLQRLLSNCPVLEDLLVCLAENGVMRKLTVVVPSLQSLSLYIPYSYSIDGIVIQTLSVKYFKLEDHNSESHYCNCLIENMLNLIEAYVDVELANINSLVGSITSVKHLAICSELEHLELCRCNELSSNLLVRLLKDSHNLQVLDHLGMEHHDYCNKVSWNKPSTVLECMLVSLQTFNWMEYTGEPEEGDLAVYILENSVHLKTATITTSCDCDDVEKFEMIKELARSSRASSKCQLMFD